MLIGDGIRKKIGEIQSLAGLCAACDEVEGHALFVSKLAEYVFIFLFEPFPLQHEALLLVVPAFLQFPHQDGIFLGLVAAQLLPFHLGPPVDQFPPFLLRPLNLHSHTLTIVFFFLRVRASYCRLPCLRWYYSAFSSSMISLLAWRREWHFLRSFSLAFSTYKAYSCLNCEILLRCRSLKRWK
jgi:hypothetical protein